MNMEIILKSILFLSVFLIIYNHFIYPCIVIFLSKKVADEEFFMGDDFTSYPHVSFIIAAYNEEKVIKNKLQNTFSLKYPNDKLEIIVVSDGSDDAGLRL